MEARQICPLCGNEFIIKNVELYIQKINESWDVIKPQFEHLPEDQQKEIKERNNIINIKEQLEKQGYIKAPCLPCHTKMAWEIQLKMRS